MKGIIMSDSKVYYIFHCNFSIGAIYSGSEEDCRVYLQNHPSLMRTSIIMDEDEYNIVRKMCEPVQRKYFEDEKARALDIELDHIF